MVTEEKEKDLEFLKEMRQHLDKGSTEMVRQMISDWINELESENDRV